VNEMADDTIRPGETDVAPACDHLEVVDPEIFTAIKAEAVRQGVLAALERRPRFIGYWDADLATPLDAIEPFRQRLLERNDIEFVFGARIRMLGRAIDRHAHRHYLGRVFATVASMTLGMGVYDTQCGAKLFRASDETAALFQRPFITGWIFDVELIARLMRQRRQSGGPPAEQVIFEQPLERWGDVAGSKVRPRDFFKAIYELVTIYRTYLRGAKHESQSGVGQAVLVQPEADARVLKLRTFNSPVGTK